MHPNQEKILELANKIDLSKMSFREIGKELGIKHAFQVKHHLDQLKKKGLIYFDLQNNRSKVAKKGAFVTDKLFNIPIVGSANCGEALSLAYENIEGYLKISPKVLNRKNPKDLFVVRAIGDSLNKADINGENIENGDYVIVDCKRQPSDGDYVLSVINDATNLKRFYKNNNTKEIKLVSESSLGIPPITLHEDDIEDSNYMVNGVVIKVIKD